MDGLMDGGNSGQMNVPNQPNLAPDELRVHLVRIHRSEVAKRIHRKRWVPGVVTDPTLTLRRLEAGPVVRALLTE